MRPSARDQQAQQLALEAGRLVRPLTAELTPERAVRVALAWWLAGLEARVEGSGQPLRPAYVGDQWSDGVRPASYPSLVLLPRSTQQRDALVAVPCQIGGRDLISVDEAWALWRVGEDVGEGVVHILANHAPQRDALASAVQDALQGNLDTLQSLGLPLPEAALPEPFRGLLEPGQFPIARVTLATAATNVDDELAAAGGVWRADVAFAWQAPRLAARTRIPDLRSEVTVSVAAPSEA